MPRLTITQYISQLRLEYTSAASQHFLDLAEQWQSDKVGKKIAKETETEKINSLESEINTLEADMKQLMDTLPGLEAKIVQLKTKIDQNKTESNTYLSTIATF